MGKLLVEPEGVFAIELSSAVADLALERVVFQELTRVLLELRQTRLIRRLYINWRSLVAFDIFSVCQLF